MTAFQMPVTTAPGQHPHESGGRLINCYAEKLDGAAGTQVVVHRVPGSTGFATSSQTGFRGALQVGSTLYSAWSGKVYKCGSGGGALEALTGNLTGTARVFMARNNAATPDLVVVSPGDGAFVASTTAVSSYPDADVGSPNAVCEHKSFFIFTRGNGTIIATGPNSTAINTLDTATAEYKPDTAYRPMSYKDNLLIWGSESVEFWGGLNDTGFPFSFISAMDIGIVGPYAVGGDTDGFDAGIYFVASDFRFSRIVGYGREVIPHADLERLISLVEDKTTITVDCYVERGRPVVVISSPTWTWEYSVTSGTFNERASYLGTRWRGLQPFKAFDCWHCGDTESGNLLRLDFQEQMEDGQPLIEVIEPGPMGAFPKPLRADRVELYLTRGVGMATGLDPQQTDPQIECQFSPDGGLSWKDPRRAKLGRQQIASGRVAFNMLGMAHPQGARLRFIIADPVPVGLMGGDLR